MIDKSLRYNYQWGGPGGKSPGASSSGGGGHDRGGQQHQATARAAVQAAKSQPVARSAPDPYRGGEVIVHTPPKTEYITKKEPVYTPPEKDVMPIVPTTKRPTEMLDIAGDIKAQEKLQEDIRESQRTGAYAEELGLPPKTIPGPLEQFLPKPKLKEIVNLGDDAKTRQVQFIQKQADLSWQNKTTREKEEQQEKWDAAESKIKLQKGGGFWKSLGNIALAMILPALLPAKLAQGYNLYKTAKTATAFANRFNLFGPKKIDLDQNVMQFVKQNIFKGVDIQKAIAGKETEFAKSVAKFSGQTDTSKEYTEDTIGKVQTAKDVEPAGQITNKQRQKYISDLEKAQGILQQGYYIDNQGRQIPLTENMRRQLSDYMNHLDRSLDPYRIPEAAHGGLIDSPLTGGSRYI
jgi:hypothetical protein